MTSTDADRLRVGPGAPIFVTQITQVLLSPETVMSTAKALREVRLAFTKAGGPKLDEDGKREFDRIFKLTLGHTLEKGKKAGVDMWADRRFRGWVLLETRKIARESAKRASAPGATAAGAVASGAMHSMRATSRVVLRAAKRDLSFMKLGIFVTKHFDETPVCGGYTKRIKAGNPAR